MKASSKKVAIIISYLHLLINTLSQILLTPFYLNHLGVDQYGLYQMVYSVAQYILVIDCGISTTMIRYISEYREKGDKKREQGFGFLLLMFVIIILVIIFIVGWIVRFNIGAIYTTLSPEEITLSKTIFISMIVQVMLTVFSHYFEGIIMAYDRYVFSKIINLLKILITFGLNFVLIYMGMGINGIVMANTIAISLTLFVEMAYVIFVLKFKVKYNGFDKDVIAPTIGLMMAMLLQSIIGHVNATIDKTILGIYSTKADVAVYSVANTFVTFFNTVPTVISSVFLPAAVKLVVAKASNEELTDFVIKPGRIQFVAAGFMLSEFFIVGKDFITRWAGKDVASAWLIALIIMVPNTVPLIQNVCLSILNAKNKRLARSVILVFLSVINVIVSILLIKHIGFIGAPIGTCISYIIGHCIIMNIYYKKAIGLNVIRMFKEILGKTIFCFAATLAVCLPLWLIKLELGYIEITMKAVIIAVVYCLLVFFFSFNNSEKSMVNNMLKKFKLIKR